MGEFDVPSNHSDFEVFRYTLNSYFLE